MNPLERTPFQPGTRVVLQKRIENPSEGLICDHGSVGVIAALPGAGELFFRVRLISGREVDLTDQEFTLLNRFKLETAGMAGAFDSHQLWQYVVYRCIVGSRAYGLDHEGSDHDRRGIYLPPAELQWSLYGLPEQLENTATEECYWELGKFLRLALKANPNVLEVLYTPLVEDISPLMEELLAIRQIFLSKLAYQTFNGYVVSQFKKIEQDLRTQGVIRWKHAMHLLRLLLSGITVMREGYVPVRVENEREQLLAVRNGLLSFAEVDAWRQSLHQSFDQAFSQTRLPDRPDFDGADQFLLKARRAMVNHAT